MCNSRNLTRPRARAARGFPASQLLGNMLLVVICHASCQLPLLKIDVDDDVDDDGDDDCDDDGIERSKSINCVLQTLAKVICSVVKFTEEETRKVLEREESRREVSIALFL